MERPLCFMRETGAPGLRLESSKKTPRHALDAAAAYLSCAAPLVIAQVAMSPKDAFYFGSADSSVEHRPT